LKVLPVRVVTPVFQAKQVLPVRVVTPVFQAKQEAEGCMNGPSRGTLLAFPLFFEAEKCLQWKTSTLIPTLYLSPSPDRVIGNTCIKIENLMDFPQMAFLKNPLFGPNREKSPEILKIPPVK
jgi:hypothetical protein